MGNKLILHTTDMPVKETLDKIEIFLNQNNVKIFSRISHSQAAKELGLSMNDEEVLIFGSPKVGTPLMLEDPNIGIELPLKILAYQKDHQTVLAYYQLDYLLQQYQIETSKNIVAKLNEFLETVVTYAISKTKE